MVEVLGSESVNSILPVVPTSRSERTLQQQGTEMADALSSVRLGDWGTSGRRVDSIILRFEHGLGRHSVGGGVGNGVDG